MNQDPLTQLRDIHLPEAVSWWPPAPGWWILALILMVSTILTTRYFLLRRRRLYFRHQAQALLRQCWETYQSKLKLLDAGLEEAGSRETNLQRTDLQEIDRQFVEGLFTVIRRAKLSAHRKPGTDKDINSNTANKSVSKNTRDAIGENEERQLKTISSAQVFGMLNNSVAGKLTEHLGQENIEALLYQHSPEALQKRQSEQLYAAARRYLEKGLR